MNLNRNSGKRGGTLDLSPEEEKELIVVRDGGPGRDSHSLANIPVGPVGPMET